MEYEHEAIKPEEWAQKRMATLEAWLSEATPKELRFAEVKLRSAKEKLVQSLKDDLGVLVPKRGSNADRQPTGRKRRKDLGKSKARNVDVTASAEE